MSAGVVVVVALAVPSLQCIAVVFMSGVPHKHALVVEVAPEEAEQM